MAEEAHAAHYQKQVPYIVQVSSITSMQLIRKNNQTADAELCWNYATRYGKACEKPALEEYALNRGEVVSTMGLVVNPMVPWLGFSPDGIVFKHGKPTILLEIQFVVEQKRFLTL